MNAASTATNKKGGRKETNSLSMHTDLLFAALGFTSRYFKTFWLVQEYPSGDFHADSFSTTHEEYSNLTCSANEDYGLVWHRLREEHHREQQLFQSTSGPSKVNLNPPRQSATCDCLDCLKFPIWLSWPKEISAARKTLTLYNFWKLQCHLKIRGSLCKDCGTGQPKGFESRGTCTCTCTCIFMHFFQDTGTSEIWTFERTGRTHLKRWAEDVSSWKPQHGALPGRGWDPTEWDQNDRGLARADGFVITPKYAFYSVHSAFARFSSIELMEHWCFEQLWLRLRSKPPGKFLTKKLSIAKQLFQSWAQCACTRTFQRTQRIPNYVFPCRSMNSWFWGIASSWK